MSPEEYADMLLAEVELQYDVSRQTAKARRILLYIAAALLIIILINALQSAYYLLG